MRSRNDRWYVVGVCLLAIFNTACNRQNIRLPDLPADTATASERVVLIEGLQHRLDEIRSFRGLSRSLVEQQGTKARVRHAVVISYPDKFRLEMLPLNAAYSLQLITAQAGRVVALDNEQHQAVETSNPRKVLNRLLGLPLSVEELSGYLLGRIPTQTMQQLKDGSARVFIDRNLGRFAVVERDSLRYWIVEAESFLPILLELRDAFKQQLKGRIRYSGFQVVNQVRVPDALKMELLESESTLALDFGRVEVNAEISPDVFISKIPTDYEVFHEK